MYSGLLYMLFFDAKINFHDHLIRIRNIINLIFDPTEAKQLVKTIGHSKDHKVEK